MEHEYENARCADMPEIDLLLFLHAFRLRDKGATGYANDVECTASPWTDASLDRSVTLDAVRIRQRAGCLISKRRQNYRAEHAEDEPCNGRKTRVRNHGGDFASIKPGTTLATITPLDPLEVRFHLPQEDGFDLRRRAVAGIPPSSPCSNFRVSRGLMPRTLQGRLDFLGSSVNQDTSTVQARAIFDNPDRMYLPGQFVRVRIEGIQRYGVLAVPEIAVTQGGLDHRFLRSIRTMLRPPPTSRSARKPAHKSSAPGSTPATGSSSVTPAPPRRA